MEVAGVVFRQSPCFSPTTADASNSSHSHSFPAMRKPNSFRPRQPNRRSFGGCVVSGEFSDKSHLKYYDGPRMAVKEKDEMASKKKKEVKKKLKLLKGLTKNLSTFSDLGFCLHPDDGLDQQVKGQMISEATDVLLGQLQKLKQVEMESKRIKKEEKAKKKASRMMVTDSKDSSSSFSSSSETSSDSDCDKVVTMSQLKTLGTTHQEPLPLPSSLQILEKPETRVTDNASSKVGEGCGKKIEVCMGGKCKKSGAAMLLENFQKAVGAEAQVLGCKCMGKCRDGPNVMVCGSGEVAAAPEVVKANSLCIGVGVDDVDAIVSSLFGGSQRSCSDKVPALSV